MHSNADLAYASRMTINFREAIRERLEELERSVYWLANQPDTPIPQTVYRYMRGDTDMRGEKLAQLLKAVGLTLTPIDDGAD